MEFGKRLRELRKWAKLSQTELANATGLNKNTISKYELNLAEPTASTLIIFSKFFEESTDYLLGLKDY